VPVQQASCQSAVLGHVQVRDQAREPGIAGREHGMRDLQRLHAGARGVGWQVTARCGGRGYLAQQDTCDQLFDCRGAGALDGEACPISVYQQDAAPRAGDPDHLGYRTGRVGMVLEHPLAAHRIEGAVREGQPRGICADECRARGVTGTGAGKHGQVDIHAHHAVSLGCRQRVNVSAWPAADIERCGPGDKIERVQTP